ncbi:MATH domain and coiled-coil domain-containing protein At3g58210-like [Papaver somniferum]|uniref:MATH domain and coiled-coil domain-containing protein At3g58210-like n=1 Tax=Papaver somniferum TaxID=3469 RepID=UPI000E6F87A0|nr:MATH domain and coiled-coil domain-containing protein At3g58210-like [Papaver somniferum]
MAMGQLVELPSTCKYIWKIENFSSLCNKVSYYSDIFNAGGAKWKLLIYPKGCKNVYDHLSLFLVPVDLRDFPIHAEFSLAVTNQTNPTDTRKLEVEYQFTTTLGFGSSKVLPLSKLYDSSAGYLVNDACEVRVEVTCKVTAKATDDNETENPISKVPEVDLEKKTKPNVESSLQFGEHPSAGQPFEGERSNCEGNELGGELYEEIGGFSVQNKNAALYKKIWLKYGHIPSTKVIPASSYSVLVMAVQNIMNSVMDMHQCRFVDLSSEMINLWEEKIKMAEKLEFNVNWLRKQLECVKKALGGMQKFKSELQKQGQTFLYARSKVKAIEAVLKTAEMQLSAAKDELRGKVSGLLLESDTEMYFQMGEDFLFDGIL